MTNPPEKEIYRDGVAGAAGALRYLSNHLIIRWQKSCWFAYFQ